MASSRGRGRRIGDGERRMLAERVWQLSDRGTPERRIAHRLRISKGLVGILKKERPPEPPKPVPGSSYGPSPVAPLVRELHANLEPGEVHRYVIAHLSPQPHESFLENLWAFADAYGCDVLFGSDPKKLKDCPAHLRPFVCTDRVRFSDDLLFIGHTDRAAAVEPLKDHVGANPGGHVLVSHPRFALQSIPRMLDAPPRYALTTGSASLPEPDAPIPALYHHALAATLVEIDSDGEVFFHQMPANADGSFQCLGDWVSAGRVHPLKTVRAITWGDLHHAIMERTIGLSSFGYDRTTLTYTGCGNLLDTLQPEDQFFSDVVHFGDRNNHVISDPVRMAQAYFAGRGNVEREIREAAGFVNLCRRDWTRIHLKEGNHERKLLKWLKDSKGRADPENAYFYHRLNAELHRQIRETKGAYRETRIVEHALREAGLAEDVEFLYRDRSRRIDGVEMAVHADKGVKGNPGSPAHFRRHGGGITLDHPHTPWACEGVYVAGTTGAIYQGYNDGWTTDAHAHVVQYHGGRRGLILMSGDGRWRATGDSAALAMAA